MSLNDANTHLQQWQLEYPPTSGNHESQGKRFLTTGSQFNIANPDQWVTIQREKVILFMNFFASELAPCDRVRYNLPTVKWSLTKVRKGTDDLDLNAH